VAAYGQVRRVVLRKKQLLLGRGIPICGHMTGLDGIPARGVRFYAVPPKMVAVGTFPVYVSRFWMGHIKRWVALRSPILVDFSLRFLARSAARS
jgi:hypothetical protein